MQQLQCNFTASVARATRAAFSSDLIAPFKFTKKYLNTEFDGVVAAWFSQQSSLEYSARYSAILNAGIVSVAANVPARFITDLGATFPAEAVAAALATALGVNVTDFFDIFVCALCYCCCGVVVLRLFF